MTRNKARRIFLFSFFLCQNGADEIQELLNKRHLDVGRQKVPAIPCRRLNHRKCEVESVVIHDSLDAYIYMHLRQYLYFCTGKGKASKLSTCDSVRLQQYL